MAEILHLSALLPAAVSTCCTVGAARSRGALGVISAVVMLLAMADLSGGRLLSPLIWSALLIASAVGGALAARLASQRADAGDGDAVGMGTHAALGLVVMAGLVVLMAAGGPAAAGSAAGHPAHAAAAAGPLTGTVWAGTAAYLAFSCALLRRGVLPPAHAVGVVMRGSAGTGVGLRGVRRDRLEVAGMAVSVALMAAALLA